ncbi:MAG: hypothetical protein ABFD25_20930 [Clostridiaceae bacterium]
MSNKLLVLKYIVTVILLAALFTFFATEMEKDMQMLNEQNARLTDEMDTLRQQNRIHENQIDDLSAQIESLRHELAGKQDKAKPNKGNDRDPEMTSLGIYTITAYCPCPKCCGKWADKRPGGKVYGAAGVELEAGVSVAAWLPFDTEIIISGRRYVVQDRTAEWIRKRYNGLIIDLYFDNHEEARSWGNPKMEVFAVR